MNRIDNLFENKKGNILSIFFTAGYPQLNDTLSIIKELDKSGVDMIEIGLPFSDPVADGPVIQRSSEKALLNGMSLNTLFEQLKPVREITNIPLILMGYINPVFKYGVEKFLQKCEETGIDGTIIPDLPVEEYLQSFEEKFIKHNVLNIFLISPQTPVGRIKYLDGIARGFLYILSTSSTTGATNTFSDSRISYFKKLNDLNLKTPMLVGFGISDKTTFDMACNYSKGAIIGSAFIKTLDKSGPYPEIIANFTGSIMKK
jgi:tryptophan synthase alpha chain